jgi:hypothetical protein
MAKHTEINKNENVHEQAKTGLYPPTPLVSTSINITSSTRLATILKPVPTSNGQSGLVMCSADMNALSHS